MAKQPIPFPTPIRMTRNAFAILDAAVVEAKTGPIKLTPAIRLALGWITVQRLTTSWQIEQFWQNMTRPVEETLYRDAYCRHRDMYLPLEAWKQAARAKGLFPPVEIWQPPRVAPDER